MRKESSILRAVIDSYKGILQVKKSYLAELYINADKVKYEEFLLSNIRQEIIRIEEKIEELEETILEEMRR